MTWRERAQKVRLQEINDRVEKNGLGKASGRCKKSDVHGKSNWSRGQSRYPDVTNTSTSPTVRKVRMVRGKK